ncbi:MAG: hypothetical protein AB7G17_04435 [Phycisphaerales bacterium]
MAMTASKRRMRCIAAATVVVLASLLAAGAAIAIAHRHSVRLDLTATRSQSLSPRTSSVLASLPERVDMLVVDAPNVDRASRRALTDLLDAFERASPRLTITTLDAATPEGTTRYDDLLTHLAQPRRDIIAAHSTALSAAFDTVSALAPVFTQLADDLEQARAALPTDDRARDALASAAGTLRVRASDLRSLVSSAEPRRTLPNAGLNLPATDTLREPIRSLLDKAAKDLAALTTLRGVALSIDPATSRDRALAAADSLSRLPTLDLLSLIRAVEAGPAVLLVSDSALTAIAYDALLATPGDERATRANAEQLLTTALAALSTPPPTIVLVHAVTPRLLDEQSNPESPDARAFFAGLLQRLANLGHAVIEWPIALQSIEPSLPTTTPSRPVVYVIIPPTASAREASTAIPRLATITKTLLDRGENVLLTLEPSLLPRVGQPDPFAELLTPFAIHADTARPLVQRLSTPRGPVIWPEFRALADQDASHPLSAPITGLSLALPWPSPLRTESPATALLQIPDSPDVWGESQWLTFRAVPREQRALAADAPTRDPSTDNTNGPWAIAAASERDTPNLDHARATQRLVVVASSAWFFDPVALEPDPNTPRPTLLNPGNSELFDASLRWLAHQDDLLARGAESLATPRIPPMTSDTLAILRWVITLAPPAMVLLLGVSIRLIRR